MFKKSLENSFYKFCEEKKFEKNSNQLKIINSLNSFINYKNNLFDLFRTSKKKLCFYLYGDVGVGKTMVLDFFYNSLDISKKRMHFNEFMIYFHDYRHSKKENSKESLISSFVQELKKNELIYLDEFQVTNIVDAMILGRLFDNIFKENIKIIISTNIKIDDL